MEQLYDIAILLRDPERYVIESVRSNASDEVAAAVSTSRLHNIAGKYTGKDESWNTPASSSGSTNCGAGS